METRFLLHPEWDGLVQGILVNAGGSASGLPGCSMATDLPIVQDEVAGAMWTGLSATSYQALIFDQQGKLVHVISPAYFQTSPASLDELESVILSLL